MATKFLPLVLFKVGCAIVVVAYVDVATCAYSEGAIARQYVGLGMREKDGDCG